MALKKAKDDELFNYEAAVFPLQGGMAQDDIAVAGEKALTCLYNGNLGKGLDSLRYRRFLEKVSVSSTNIVSSSTAQFEGLLPGPTMERRCKPSGAYKLGMETEQWRPLSNIY